MIELRWKKDVIAWRTDSVQMSKDHTTPQFYYLQYRDVVERDEYGQVLTATDWTDVGVEE